MENIVIASINGKADFVTFRSTASTILQSFYDASRDADPEADKIRMSKAAADLIKTDIKSKDISKSFHPLPGEISSLDENCAFLPETLYLFLKTIFNNKKSAERKIASIGQAIIQAARPRVLIVPLQIGLAVQMHHHYGFKFLIDSLNSHGLLDTANERVDIKKKELVNYPTARLWLQYMDMEALLCQFIEAERTGNWELHLQSLRDMLSFYAAAGHNLYAKSVYIHLQ